MKKSIIALTKTETAIVSGGENFLSEDCIAAAGFGLMSICCVVVFQWLQKYNSVINTTGHYKNS